MDGCFPRCKNNQQSVAGCVAVTRYIYTTHVFSDKRRENKGLVQITNSQNTLLLSATSTSRSHGAPLARRPPFLLWHAKIQTMAMFSCSLSWKKLCHCFLASSLLAPLFGADCGNLSVCSLMLLPQDRTPLCRVPRQIRIQGLFCQLL